MSCDYNVHCRECNSTHGGFSDANHQDKLMRALIKHAVLIGQLAPLFAEQAIAYDVYLKTHYGAVDVDWFATHATHDLVVIDEYGRVDGTCGFLVTCKCCLHHLGWCGLPAEHHESVEHEINPKES